MLVTEPFWVVATTEDYVCVASLFYVMLVHVQETCQIRKFEGENVIRYIAWPTTHGSFRDDRHGHIVTSGHHSLPELDTIFLAVIRWRSCSIVVVVRANLFFTMRAVGASLRSFVKWQHCSSNANVGCCAR